LIFQEAHRWFRRWAFLLEIPQFTAVLARFNSFCSWDRFFSALVATASPRWLFRGSNGFGLVTRTASLGMMVEAVLNSVVSQKTVAIPYLEPYSRWGKLIHAHGLRIKKQAVSSGQFKLRHASGPRKSLCTHAAGAAQIELSIKGTD
jgi:hypothetical protein